ncbi:uncharacterized protein N7459_009405 [Penicillium hispanicum]|uniref:uncharacterized protein n=1 Tax=Penicillium hispanicum TaxID=1080232 RepID=UPI002540FAC5|nr:uncharacterized protein N7459_009405 [Penicillium hispanicum]KAJ5569975.1 hypothetical protein N7459_009405 [Penicillium hispanicum]
MPLVVPKRSSRTHPVLPITLTITTSLVIALCYLQLLYGVSYLARPFWSRRREFPPFRSVIERWERLAIDIIMGIVPSPIYRSPTPTLTSTLHEDSQGYRISSIHVSRASWSQSNPSAFSVPPNMPQCYPETAAERNTENQPAFRVDSPKPTPVNRYSKDDFSPYNAMNKDVQYSVTAPTEAYQHTLPLYTRSTQSLRLPQGHLHPLHKIELQNSEAALNTPNLSPTSPVCSLDDQKALATTAQSIQALDVEPDEDELKLGERVIKCRSTASYPGKFPVSEGTEFSSLATAEYAFRERGTTSVRPFSDY